MNEKYNQKLYIIRKLLAQNSLNLAEAKSLSGLDEKNADLLLGKENGPVFMETSLKNAFLIKPQVWQDDRGFFKESYTKKKLAEKGIETEFIQDNHSLSRDKGVLRGLHFQAPPLTQTKLVRVIRGSVYDVIVDLRQDSPTYGKWEAFVLSGRNFLQLYVPQGFAHGFCTLEENTEFLYKVDNYYSAEHDQGIIWNDHDLNIPWPTHEPILSEKDTRHPFLKDVKILF